MQMTAAAGSKWGHDPLATHTNLGQYRRWQRISPIAAVVLAVVLNASVAEARYCNSPACRMCERLFGTLAPVPQGIYVEQIQHVSAKQIESTPQVVVDVMLRELHLTPKDVLYDLGCGDGRMLIAAVQQYGCQAVGIEIDPQVAAIALVNVRQAGCGGITIVIGDATQFDLSKATAATMYLFPPLMSKLLPKLTTERIVSYSHELPGRACRQVVVDGKYNVYVMQPARAASWSWTD